jgi:AcrR family transcriptional regulator
MGTLERRHREKEHRREMIISTAEQVFSQRGYESATMDYVAEKAELSKGTLYLYFKSKPELLLGLVVSNLKQINQRYQAILEEPINGYAQITKIGETYFTYFEKKPKLLELFGQAEALSGDSLQTSRSMKEWNIENKKSFQKLQVAFVNGKRDGSVKAALDPLHTTILFGILSPAIIKAVIFKKQTLKTLGVKPEAFMEYAFNFLGRSIGNVG